MLAATTGLALTAFVIEHSTENNVVKKSGVSLNKPPEGESIESMLSRIFSAQELKKFKQLMEQGEAKIYGGDICILKGVNVRKDRHISSDTVEWKDIIELNGVNIQQADSFTATSPLIVYPPYPAGLNQPPWLAFKATVNGLFGRTNKQTVYINFSNETADFVKLVIYGTNRASPVNYVGGIIPQITRCNQ